jgi:hypothetical protein
MQRVTPMAVQGGGPGMLPDVDWKRMRGLITVLRKHLPEDHSRLPPPGRRAILQVRRGKRVIARVYDRADLPESIAEIFGLTGATHGPMAMDFVPAATATQGQVSESDIPPDAIGIRRPHPRDPATNGIRPDSVILAISPDHSLTVTRYLFLDDRTVVSHGKSSVVVFEKPNGLSGRRFIYVSRASFSPDGRYLLLQSNLPAVYVYETKNWGLANTEAKVPPDRVAYYPANDWKHGVEVKQTGSVVLWDAISARKMTTLDVDGELQSVSFSPDGSLVATTSVRQNPDQSSTFHLRLWDAKTGHFVRELRSLYYFEHDVIGDPMWWGGGKYLLAETKEGQFGPYVIAVWNAESGKLRGGFSGCGFSDDRFDVALSGDRLFKWCRSDKLLTWNIPEAIKQVSTFEAFRESARAHVSGRRPNEAAFNSPSN